MDLIFGIAYAIATGIVILFQGCLAAGLPWGAASMGGKFPGKYPTKMRYAAAVNMLILALLTLIVLIRAHVTGLRFYALSKNAIWLVVLFSAISVVLNLITKSKIERIWVPVTLVQLVSSIMVAL